MFSVEKKPLIQTGQLDIRVAGLRLLHQPPFIPAAIVLIGGAALVAGLRAVCRVGVGADLDLQELQRRPVAWLEEIIEDLVSLRRGIVVEQPRGAAAAAKATDEIE